MFLADVPVVSMHEADELEDPCIAHVWGSLYAEGRLYGVLLAPALLEGQIRKLEDDPPRGPRESFLRRI